jgi:hypothetical protein
MADLNYKLDLIAQSLSLGQVSETEAFFSASKLTGNDREDVVKMTVLDRSARLLGVTRQRELIVRELDET